MLKLPRPVFFHYAKQVADDRFLPGEKCEGLVEKLALRVLQCLYEIDRAVSEGAVIV